MCPRYDLKEEVNRYNYHQVHSTTGEIPGILFDKALKEGNSLFRPFTLPRPYTSAKDVFCLREKRMVNGYRRVSLFSQEIEVPNVTLLLQPDMEPDRTKRAAILGKIIEQTQPLYVVIQLGQVPIMHAYSPKLQLSSDRPYPSASLGQYIEMFSPAK